MVRRGAWKGRYSVLSLGVAVLLVALTSVGSWAWWGQRAIAQSGQAHYLAANADTVHWGYFSQSLAPQLTVDSGDTITVETLTHHANDDASLMVLGDPGAESVYEWTPDFKGVDRRGPVPRIRKSTPKARGMVQGSIS
jgi:hypothetical protein